MLIMHFHLHPDYNVRQYQAVQPRSRSNAFVVQIGKMQHIVASPGTFQTRFFRRIKLGSGRNDIFRHYFYLLLERYTGEDL